MTRPFAQNSLAALVGCFVVATACSSEDNATGSAGSSGSGGMALAGRGGTSDSGGGGGSGSGATGTTAGRSGAGGERRKQRNRRNIGERRFEWECRGQLGGRRRGCRRCALRQAALRGRLRDRDLSQWSYVGQSQNGRITVYNVSNAPPGAPRRTVVVTTLFGIGFTDSWRSFERVLPHLPKWMRVLVLTQRGHGDASRPEAGYALPDLAADVAAFLDALSRAGLVRRGYKPVSAAAPPPSAAAVPEPVKETFCG
jgi:hypothetical protein